MISTRNAAPLDKEISNPRSSDPIVSLEGVSKTYWKGKREIKALVDVFLKIYDGQLITIQGPSGCGKTTLLNMIGMMDSPSKGSIFIKGQKVSEMNEEERSDMIAKNIGFVFQAYNLIDHLNALDNVAAALDAKDGKDHKKSLELAAKVLERVGLGDRLYNKPAEMSGGEQQRVAIARALIKDPVLIIADEPTGELDTENGQKVVDLFKELNEKEGKTIMIVTHDQRIGASGKRRIRMQDYKILSDES